MGSLRSGIEKTGSPAPIRANSESDLRLINAATTLRIGVSNRFFGTAPNTSFISPFSSNVYINRYFPGGDLSGKSIEFKSLDTTSVAPQRKVIADLGDGKPLDVLEFQGAEGATSVDIFLAVTDTARGIGRYRDSFGGSSKSAPTIITVPTNAEQFLGGIAIQTASLGNDLILSSGPGILRNTTDKDSFTLVNRTPSYVNVQNGDDVVVGGFGSDFFGSKSYSELVSLSSAFKSSSSSSNGSKVFVGGSGNDVLDGGLKADYLVGDRLNGYELYLDLASVSNRQGAFATLPSDSPWGTQAVALNTYGQAYRGGEAYRGEEINGSGVGSRLTGEIVNTRGGVPTSKTPYSLWIPGNDVIRGYEGNDFIFGDENIFNNLAQLKVLKDSITGVDPSNTARFGTVNARNFNSIRLGADFIDGGADSDVIYAGFGSDAIIGGTGADFIDIGPQIAVKGYTPFFGPKVAFGDRAFWDGNQWQSDPSSKAPDQFVVGPLLTQESDIAASSANASLNYGTSSSLQQSLEAFEEKWAAVDKFISLIPKAGEIISTVVDTGVSILKALYPAPQPFEIVGDSRPKANDTITVIKDFDPFDQLTFSLNKGEQYEARKTTNLTLSSDASNPLLGNIQGKRGTIIEVRGDAGTVYNRVFLEGYESGLVSLKIESTDQATYYTLGGRDYGDVLDGNGNPAFGQVF